MNAIIAAFGVVFLIGFGVYGLWIFPREVELKKKQGAVQPITEKSVPWVRGGGAMVLLLAALVLVLTVLGQIRSP